MARHLTAYQKACREIETEGRKQCYLLYSATSLALSRHWNKGRKAIANLFLITQDMWNECAKDNMHSMIEMCEKETGIEIQNGEGKSWHDLPYLNATLDPGRMTNAKWIYMRQQQKKWIAPQVMACIMIALHRKYRFGFDRLQKIYDQVREIQAQYNMDPTKILDACREETGILIQEIVTQK